jgi:hypothetical protein
MANVKANLASNYKVTASSKTYYFIETQYNPKKIEVEIDKSPGFTKQALVKVNSDLKLLQIVSSQSSKRIYRYTLQLLHHQCAKDNKTSFVSN